MTSVLLVEDDPATAELLTWALERHGYQVLEARDGKQALDFLRASDVPLIVLLDARLPEMDGLSLLTRVGADSWLVTTHAYVLMSTPYEERSVCLHQIPFPAPVDLLSKPFGLEQLWRVLSRATRRIGASSQC